MRRLHHLVFAAAVVANTAAICAAYELRFPFFKQMGAWFRRPTIAAILRGKKEPLVNLLDVDLSTSRNREI
jgi:hypothetical protein